MNETLSSAGNRHTLRIERRMAHPPAKIWRAITEPAQLNQWFPFDVELDLQIDSTITFLEKGGAGPSSGGVITACDPPRLLAYTWGDDLLRFELHADGEGCLLIFTHTFGDRSAAASYASGWQVCLDALERVVEGRPIEVPHNMDEVHERYVEAFGLAEGSAEETPDGWRARFERQMIRPIDTVWATLAAAADHRAPVVGGPPPRAFTTEKIPSGVVTAVEAPVLLEYEWLFGDRPAGCVRWELSNGTGHGTRLVLTQTGPSELVDEQSTALKVWQAHIEQLARQLLGTPA